MSRINWWAIRAAQPHYLYRCYDADGALLYVGMTYNPPARMRQHAKRAAWYPLADSFRLTVFPSREYAAEKEREAIIRERPRFNKTHRWDLPPGVDNDEHIYSEADLPPELQAQLRRALNTIFKRPYVEPEPCEIDLPTAHDRKREALRLLGGGAA